MTHSIMDQTESIQDVSLLSLRLSMIEALIHRLSNSTGLTIRDIRRFGITLLRIPYIRLPRSPRTKRSAHVDTAPPRDPEIIAQITHYNETLTVAKRAIQALFLALIKHPETPAAEADRMTLASLRCPLPADLAATTRFVPNPLAAPPTAGTSHQENPDDINTSELQNDLTIDPSAEHNSDPTSTPSPTLTFKTADQTTLQAIHHPHHQIHAPHCPLRESA